MVAFPSTAPPFVAPAIPWLTPKPLGPELDLGPGLDYQRCAKALVRLCADPEVQALVAFGARAGRRERILIWILR
jgi:hypothetical protein